MTCHGGRFWSLVASAWLVASLFGCASTTPIETWNPGAADALTVQHYAQAHSAIEAKAKLDAQAAMYLLRSDVLRMRTNSLSMQAAAASLYGVSNAVDREDWGDALKLLQALKATYGHP